MLPPFFIAEGHRYMTDIAHLQGLGPKSRDMLQAIGIVQAEQLMEADAFALYAQLKSAFPSTSLNFLYAILGAQNSCHWQDIKNTRRLEILLRLEEMGLAPKK